VVGYISYLYCNKYKRLKPKPQMWAGVTLLNVSWSISLVSIQVY